MAAKDDVLAVMQANPGPMLLGDIANLAGISGKEAHEAISALMADGRIKRDGKGGPGWICVPEPTAKRRYRPGAPA
jgi:predicted HTH transcriptional regulator